MERDSTHAPNANIHLEIYTACMHFEQAEAHELQSVPRGSFPGGSLWWLPIALKTRFLSLLGVER